MDYNEIELIAPPLARVLAPCAERGLHSREQDEEVAVYEHPAARGE